MDRLIAEAESIRPDLAAVRSRAAAARAHVRSVRAAGLPALGASASVSRPYYDNADAALPFAGFGALLTLLIFKVELSIYAFVGIILLVGLVKKNGIMMVDFAAGARRAGKGAEEAIYEACVVRFRPIMMTSMSALMGTLPIALGFGAGAESRRPLGLAVVGGLLFSQMITLYVTPVFYVYMDHLAEWLKRRRGKKADTGPQAVHPAAAAAGL